MWGPEEPTECTQTPFSCSVGRSGCPWRPQSSTWLWPLVFLCAMGLCSYLGSRFMTLCWSPYVLAPIASQYLVFALTPCSSSNVSWTLIVSTAKHGFGHGSSPILHTWGCLGRVVWCSCVCVFGNGSRMHLTFRWKGRASQLPQMSPETHLIVLVVTLTGALRGALVGATKGSPPEGTLRGTLVGSFHYFTMCNRVPVNPDVSNKDKEVISSFLKTTSLGLKPL